MSEHHGERERAQARKRAAMQAMLQAFKEGHPEATGELLEMDALPDVMESVAVLMRHSPEFALQVALGVMAPLLVKKFIVTHVPEHLDGAPVTRMMMGTRFPAPEGGTGLTGLTGGTALPALVFELVAQVRRADRPESGIVPPEVIS